METLHWNGRWASLRVCRTRSAIEWAADQTVRESAYGSGAKLGKITALLSSSI
jgi:hypothetical protein